MTERSALIEKVLSMIRDMDGPIPDSELRQGWNHQSRSAMKELFVRLRDDIMQGKKVSDEVEYITIARGLDHWGIEEGMWYDRATDISSEIRGSSL